MKINNVNDESELMLTCGQPTTQDLLDICSGDFTDIVQTCSEVENAQSQSIPAEPLSTQNLLEEGCNDVLHKDNSQQTSVETRTLNQINEIKSLDMDQDMLISQLLDEEEIEQIEEKEVASGGILDSDNDEDTLEIKRKHKKKLRFSG